MCSASNDTGCMISAILSCDWVAEAIGSKEFNEFDETPGSSHENDENGRGQRRASCVPAEGFAIYGVRRPSGTVLLHFGAKSYLPAGLLV